MNTVRSAYILAVVLCGAVRIEIPVESCDALREWSAHANAWAQRSHLDPREAYYAVCGPADLISTWEPSAP